jgi:uncharacterized LabA/DUF88 family protein
MLKTYFPGEIEKIFYFTTLTPWDVDKVARHKIFIRALESTGVEMVYGKFKDRHRTCPHCKKIYKGKEEKQTDVGIALTMFRLAYEKKHEGAVLVSGDSDQLPTFREVHRYFPGFRLNVLLPVGREAAELKIEADRYIRIREKVLRNCLFDDPLTLADGTVLNKPPDWI